MQINVIDEKDKTILYQAFGKFQDQVGNPKKNQTNPFAKSKYADLQSVIDEVKKGMKNTGLSFIQDYSTDENAKVLSVRTILIHEKGTIEFEPLRVPIEKVTAQGIGSATTYARRYALTTNLGIAIEDDDGNLGRGTETRKSNSNNSYQGQGRNRNTNSTANKNNNNPTKQGPAEPKITSVQLQNIETVINDLARLVGQPVQEIYDFYLKSYSIKQLTDLTAKKADELNNKIQSNFKQKQQELQGAGNQ